MTFISCRFLLEIPIPHCDRSGHGVAYRSTVLHQKVPEDCATSTDSASVLAASFNWPLPESLRDAANKPLHCRTKRRTDHLDDFSRYFTRGSAEKSRSLVTRSA